MQVKYQIQDKETGILARQSCGSFTISELRKLREIGKLLEVKTR